MLWRNLDWVPMGALCTAWSILFQFVELFLWVSCMLLLSSFACDAVCVKGLKGLRALNVLVGKRVLSYWAPWMTYLVAKWMALISMFRHLEDNLDDWLEEGLEDYLDDDYLVFDCPGIHTCLVSCFSVFYFYFYFLYVLCYWLWLMAKMTMKRWRVPLNFNNVWIQGLGYLSVDLVE